MKQFHQDQLVYFAFFSSLFSIIKFLYWYQMYFHQKSSIHPQIPEHPGFVSFSPGPSVKYNWILSIKQLILGYLYSLLFFPLPSVVDSHHSPSAVPPLHPSLCRNRALRVQSIFKCPGFRVLFCPPTLLPQLFLPHCLFFLETLLLLNPKIYSATHYTSKSEQDFRFLRPFSVYSENWTCDWEE